MEELVPQLRKQYNCSFCIANGENLAGGAGLTAKCIKEISPGIVDVITSGDHIWDQRGFELEIEQFKHVLRPANLSKSQPGRGYGVFRNPGSGEVGVVNLQGKIFIKDSAYCPFETVERILSEMPKTVKNIFVDFHAEATSEKAAMAYFLDGKVTAVVGTHTHVQTADACILPGGTAFISDIGMVGGKFSILGREVESVIKKFRTGMPTKIPAVEKNIRLDAVVISYNILTGKASEIKNISLNASF